MAEKMEVYKCEICGNIVEVLHGGKGELTCCGEAMKKMEEQTADSAVEKHVPVIEKGKDGIVTVKVGSIPHPMEEKHHIEWVQLIMGEKAYRIFLDPGDAAEADFTLEGDNVHAREYCNIHGLWKV